MAYTVLARRYRSQTFDDVIGQNHIAQTLKKAIASGRVAHAFLFTGTRGTGKTSMARILAKALNCQAAKAPTTEPCLKCDACQAIARGDDMDVIEIDAASNTQVEKTRTVILENTQYRPATSRFKIFIIDEVHMLSKASFNALLKTIEEPPDFVKFILATTEVEKVLPTILSRCQRYDFRNIPTREIAGHLRRVCKDEKIEAEEEALMLVAKAGAGSMRDALSVLERLLSIGEKKLTTAVVEELLGLPRAMAIHELAQAIGEGKANETLTRADDLITNGLSPDSLVAVLGEHFRNLMILRACGAESNLVEAAGLSVQELAAQAQRFDAPTLSQDIVILEEVRRQMRQSGAGRALLDAALVRLALAEQFVPIVQALDQADGNAPATPVQKKKLEVTEPPKVWVAPQVRAPVAAEPAPVVLERVVDPAPVVVAADPAPAMSVTAVAEEDDDLPRPGKVFEGPSLKEMMQRSKRPEPAAQPEPAPPAPDPSGLWPALLQLLADKPGLHAFLQLGRFAGFAENQALIRFPADQRTAHTMVSRNGKKEQVAEAVSQIVGRPMGVRFDLDDAPVAPLPSTPAPAAASERRFERPPVAEIEAQPAPVQNVRPTAEQLAAYEKEPLVAALIKQFGATIVKVSDGE